MKILILSRGNRDTSKVEYGEGNQREVENFETSRMLEAFIPELVKSYTVGSEDNGISQIGSLKGMANVGKPFKLGGRYIDKRGQKTEDKLIDIFKGLK